MEGAIPEHFKSIFDLRLITIYLYVHIRRNDQAIDGFTNQYKVARSAPLLRKLKLSKNMVGCLKPIRGAREGVSIMSRSSCRPTPPGLRRSSCLSPIQSPARSCPLPDRQRIGREIDSDSKPSIGLRNELLFGLHDSQQCVFVSKEASIFEAMDFAAFVVLSECRSTRRFLSAHTRPSAILTLL